MTRTRKGILSALRPARLDVQHSTTAPEGDGRPTEQPRGDPRSACSRIGRPHIEGLRAPPVSFCQNGTMNMYTLQSGKARSNRKIVCQGSSPRSACVQMSCVNLSRIPMHTKADSRDRIAGTLFSRAIRSARSARPLTHCSPSRY